MACCLLARLTYQQLAHQLQYFTTSLQVVLMSLRFQHYLFFEDDKTFLLEQRVLLLLKAALINIFILTMGLKDACNVKETASSTAFPFSSMDHFSIIHVITLYLCKICIHIYKKIILCCSQFNGHGTSSHISSEQEFFHLWKRMVI